MQITQREVRGVIILDLEGRLVLEGGVTRILLNFAKVTYLDSAGVGAVAWKYVTVRKRNGDVKLLNLQPKSHTVLKTTKLLAVLESFESEDAAIDSFVDRDDDEDINPIFT